MNVERSSVLRRVTDLLRASVLAGSLPPLLPSETELQRQFGASRNVIRDALAVLRSEGLVERQQGTGTFVVGTRYRHRVDQFGRFDPSRTGARVERELYSSAVEPATGIVQTVLGLSENSDTVRVERLTITAGEPTSLWTSYLPPDLEPVVEQLMPDEHLHDAIGRVGGVPVSEVHFSINAGLAHGPLAEALQVAEGAPLLREQRTARRRDGRVIEFALGWTRGDRMTMETIRRDM